MKHAKIFKGTVVASAMAAVFGMTTVFATELFKVQPSAVYQVIRDKPLSEALANVAQRSGIVFKINIDISKNLVSQTLVANDWDSAVSELLNGYNYSVIREGGKKLVIISGYNGSIPDSNANPVIPPDKLIEIAPSSKSVPAKYKSYPAGAVHPVELPMNAIMALQEGESTTFDLPIGQFEATYDTSTTDEAGNNTWIGHLSEEGPGYRMMLSQGAAGVMGHIITPEGTFNLETAGSSTVLIDTRLLKSAGYAHDTSLPGSNAGTAVMQNAPLSISQLQAAVDAAKKTNDEAQALAKTVKEQNTQAIAAYDAANTNNVAVMNANNAASVAYSDALAAYQKDRSHANAKAMKLAFKMLQSAKAQAIAASNAYRTALAKKNASADETAAKVAAAAETEAVYAAAVKALTDAQKTVSAGTTPTVSGSSIASAETTIDIMVLYTTAGMTPAYAKQRLAYLVSASNQAYADSGIHVKLRLVYAEPTSYSDHVSNSEALADLASDRGEFAGISQKRAQYGADLVFLWRPLYAKTAGSCGNTYQESVNGSPVNKAFGYGTINDGSALDMAGYYCEISTFTHEIGHSLGLTHDREYSSIQGAYGYSYAWGIQDKFGTIMSYKSPVVMLFSTPTLPTQCAGTPCGFDETNPTQSSDQVKSANLTAPSIANFMPTLVTTPTIN